MRRYSAPLHYVRRVDRVTAISVLRTPAIALFFAGAEDAPTIPTGGCLDVPVVEETLDAAANRAMLALLLGLRRRAQTLRDRLQQAVDREAPSDTRTALATRWPARKQFLDDVIAQLSFLVRQSPFTHVRRPEITAAGLTAIAADPTYSRAWGRGWRALRHGVESGESTERLWVSPSWEIYERWCFLRLGQLLAEKLPAWNWHRLKSPGRWVGAFSGRHAKLRLQPTFRSREQDTDKMWSISKERVPDLVLTVRSDNNVRFVVLDAKYRSSRANVLDAMESAHIYQDSLRIGSRRPEASLLLIPSGGAAGWLEQPAFQFEHRVGVHPFSPADEVALPEIVVNVLGG
jgi:hypothetical protein